MIIPYRVKETVKNIKYDSYKKQKRRTDLKNSDHIALFYMGALFPDRRTVQIYKQLQIAGYKCVLYFANYRKWVKAAFLHNWRYSELILKDGIIDYIPNQIEILCQSSFDKEPNIPCNKKLIVHDQIMHRLTELTGETFFYPIHFHPTKMRRDIERECLMSDVRNRCIGILFVGNTSSEYRKREKNLHEKYHIYSRPEVLNYVEKNCIDRVFVPKSFEDLCLKMKSKELEDKIVLVREFRLDEKQYFWVLSQSKYYLHCAGVDIPYCHNQIESMACGVVPISNFTQYYPDLVDGINCIAYQDLDQLKEICEDICSKKTRFTFEVLSNNVKEWYSNHYSFEEFTRRIKLSANSNSKAENYYIFKELSPALTFLDLHTSMHF